MFLQKHHSYFLIKPHIFWERRSELLKQNPPHVSPNVFLTIWVISRLQRSAEIEYWYLFYLFLVWLAQFQCLQIRAGPRFYTKSFHLKLPHDEQTLNPEIKSLKMRTSFINIIFQEKFEITESNFPWIYQISFTTPLKKMLCHLQVEFLKIWGWFGQKFFFFQSFLKASKSTKFWCIFYLFVNKALNQTKIAYFPDWKFLNIKHRRDCIFLLYLTFIFFFFFFFFLPKFHFFFFFFFFFQHWWNLHIQLHQSTLALTYYTNCTWCMKPVCDQTTRYSVNRKSWMV